MECKRTQRRCSFDVLAVSGLANNRPLAVRRVAGAGAHRTTREHATHGRGHASRANALEAKASHPRDPIFDYRHRPSAHANTRNELRARRGAPGEEGARLGCYPKRRRFHGLAGALTECQLQNRNPGISVRRELKLTARRARMGGKPSGRAARREAAPTEPSWLLVPPRGLPRSGTIHEGRSGAARAAQNRRAGKIPRRAPGPQGAQGPRGGGQSKGRRPQAPRNQGPPRTQ